MLAGSTYRWNRRRRCSGAVGGRDDRDPELLGRGRSSRSRRPKSESPTQGPGSPGGRGTALGGLSFQCACCHCSGLGPSRNSGPVDCDWERVTTNGARTRTVRGSYAPRHDSPGGPTPSVLHPLVGSPASSASGEMCANSSAPPPPMPPHPRTTSWRQTDCAPGPDGLLLGVASTSDEGSPCWQRRTSARWSLGRERQTGRPAELLGDRWARLGPGHSLDSALAPGRAWPLSA